MISVAATVISSRVAVSLSGLPSAGKVDKIAALPAEFCTATVTT
jgi:hypothetical protein